MQEVWGSNPHSSTCDVSPGKRPAGAEESELPTIVIWSVSQWRSVTSAGQRRAGDCLRVLQALWKIRGKGSVRAGHGGLSDCRDSGRAALGSRREGTRAEPDQPMLPQPRGQEPDERGEDGAVGPASRRRGWVRRSTATSCRSTSNAASLAADDWASRTSQPQRRTKMRSEQAHE